MREILLKICAMLILNFVLSSVLTKYGILHILTIENCSLYSKSIFTPFISRETTSAKFSIKPLRKYFRATQSRHLVLTLTSVKLSELIVNNTIYTKNEKVT